MIRLKILNILRVYRKLRQNRLKISPISPAPAVHLPMVIIEKKRGFIPIGMKPLSIFRFSGWRVGIYFVAAGSLTWNDRGETAFQRQ